MQHFALDRLFHKRHEYKRRSPHSHLRVAAADPAGKAGLHSGNGQVKRNGNRRTAPGGFKREVQHQQ